MARTATVGRRGTAGRTALRGRAHGAARVSERAKSLVPKAVKVGTKRSVWVVNQVRVDPPSDGGEVSLAVMPVLFGTYRKAAECVRREFANDGYADEFDAERLASGLFLSNAKCRYYLEECEVN